MRIDHSLYSVPVIPDDHFFNEKFRFTPELKKLVAFSSAMKLPRHRWFYFKPGFAPAIVHHLIEKYANKNGKFCDPFSGVGTAPLVASEMGFESVGFDISPLGVIIGQSKIVNLTAAEVASTLSAVQNFEPYGGQIEHYYLNKAYDKDTIRVILGVRDEIERVDASKELKSFLRLCLLSICDRFAHVKKDGGFLRYVDKDIPVDFFETFKQTALDFAKDSENHPYSAKHTPEFKIGDARSLSLEDESISVIVTSPPYLNRYDYTRIYAIEMAIMGLSDEEVKRIRKDTLKSHIEAKHRPCPELKSTILSIVEEELPKRKLSNAKIPEMVSGYFHDMAWNIKDVARVLEPGGFAAYVVGNCRFSGIHVEVDAIIGQIGESFGLEVEEILIAKTRGSSAQQVRVYGDLPLRESIVILRKPT
jgi:DNA modification methylase